MNVVEIDDFQIVAFFIYFVLYVEQKNYYYGQKEEYKNFTKLIFYGMLGGFSILLATALLHVWGALDNILINYLVYVVTALYDCFMFMEAWYFREMVIQMTGAPSRIHVSIDTVISAVYGIMLITNMITGWGFRVGQGDYIYGEWYALLYIPPLFVLFHSLLILLFYENKVSRRFVISSMFFGLSPILGAILEIMSDYDFISFSVSLSALIVTFTLETPDYTRLMKVNAKIEETKAKTEAAKEKAANEQGAKNRLLNNLTKELIPNLEKVDALNGRLRFNENEEVHKLAVKINGENHVLRGILDEANTLSKVESGTAKLKYETYNLKDFIIEISDDFKSQCDEKGIYLKFDVDANIPELMIGDYRHLIQVFRKLIGDAIKYTQTGGITVRFIRQNYLEIKGRTSAKIKMEIEDTGQGILPSDLNMILEELEAAYDDSRNSLNNTGLDLNVIMGVLKLMDSQLKIRSVFGKGTCFYFSLLQEVPENTNPIGDISHDVVSW